MIRKFGNAGSADTPCNGSRKTDCSIWRFIVPVAVAPEKIPVVLLYNVDPQWTQTEKEEVISLSTQLGHALIEVGYPTIFVPIADDDIANHLHSFDPSEYIIFNWCESLPGLTHSEWLVAKRLEMLGFTFTGADSETLALAQDKYRVKVLLEQAGIPTPAWRIFHHGETCEWNRFPAIVKPMNEHCSAGITRESVVLNQTELENRIPFILDTYQQPAMVEDFIDGREFHVSVWGNEKLTVLPVAEMDFSFFSNIKDRLCTYDAKFIPGSDAYEKIETLLPAPLTAEEKTALEKVCCDAYLALGCRDYARLDIRLRDNVFYVLDVNPNADISHEASMACAAEVAGISYGQMGSMFVRLAARRHPVFGKMAEQQDPAKKQSVIKRTRAKRASSFKEPQAS
ncbi:MAG: D-alanine--D-alanine ligase [Deltaproteobacteria bacterium]|nr:D-alanine--D-alanine ligase [Deltaproteobacteria bacterium]